VDAPVVVFEQIKRQITDAQVFLAKAENAANDGDLLTLMWELGKATGALWCAAQVVKEHE